MPEAEPKKKNPLGATGKTVAANVKRLRLAKGLAFVDLAAILEQIKRPIPTLGLRHIEAEKRRVDSDDLVALAVALGVSPRTLLTPNANEKTELVSVSGLLKPVEVGHLWNWLGATDDITDNSLDWLEFGSRAWPPFVRRDVGEREKTRIAERDLRQSNEIVEHGDN